MPIVTDYHMHPQAHRLQPYSQELLQPWAESARKRGIKDFVVTDHDRYHTAVDFDQIALFQERNPDLTIGAGIELDNDPVNSEAGRKWVEKNWDQLDFVLGSIHFLGDWPFDHAGQEVEFARRDIDEVYAWYVREMDKLIGLGHIDVLAHLDLIKIFKFFPQQELVEVFRPILKQIKAAGLGMEVNTAGWRKPIGIPYPDDAIVRAAVELGIPFTFSSDAHSHFQIGEDFDKLAPMLKAWGFKEVAVYKKHQRTMLPLDLA